MTTISRFRVEGLHGSRTIDIPIHDNRLVLVGENGTGKSTVVNLIYFLLTRQWNRLREYRFSAILAQIGDHSIHITHEQLDLFGSRAGRHSSKFPHAIRRALFRFSSERQMEELLENPDFLEHFAEEYGATPRAMREIIREYYEENSQGNAALQATGQKIGEVVTEQLLYLPTYRRIEQDLKSIFRGVEVDTQLRQFRERISLTRSEAAYIELVEFGMQDVERTLAAKMTQIKENVRNGLNALTGHYLRDVIRGVYPSLADSSVVGLEPSMVEAVLARIDESVLPQADKSRLTERVRSIAILGATANDDPLVMHFLTLLLRLHNDQLKAEGDVREFVRVCNEYLVGKAMHYDDSNFSISIQSVGSQSRPYTKAAEVSDRLELKMLSSGEKQIVSLFSHLYLSGRASFFLIIDEPELSLSVPWQRRFLTDILDSGKCSGLVSVTHSPFIWDNALEPYVCSLAQFSEETDVLR